LPADIVGKHREGSLYVLFGAFTLIISWASYAIFVWLGIELNISNILSWICAVSFAFIVNKWFVFGSRSLDRTTLIKEIGSFFALRILIGVIAILCFSALLGFGLDQPLFNTDGFIARIITSFIEIVLNYLASKFLVFRKTPDC